MAPFLGSLLGGSRRRTLGPARKEALRLAKLRRRQRLAGGQILGPGVGAGADLARRHARQQAAAGPDLLLADRLRRTGAAGLVAARLFEELLPVALGPL